MSDTVKTHDKLLSLIDTYRVTSHRECKQIQDISNRALAASDGDWTHETQISGIHWVECDGQTVCDMYHLIGAGSYALQHEYDNDADNATFVTHAKRDVTSLLSLIDARDQLIEALIAARTIRPIASAPSKERFLARSTAYGNWFEGTRQGMEVGGAVIDHARGRIYICDAWLPLPAPRDNA